MKISSHMLSLAKAGREFYNIHITNLYITNFKITICCYTHGGFMFLGRDRELSALESEYNANGFRMTILYGRRRVGKTELLNKFSEDKDVIFFTASEASTESNLTGFETAVFEALSPGGVHPHFQSFEEAFLYIGDNTGKKKLLVIIDEYPYLAESDKSISSVLQKCIDTDWKEKNIYLILCGSSISFMEDEVLAGKSPLYGRRTSQLDLLPFNYKESAEFVPEYTFEEKAIVYGVTGGVAKYLELFDAGLSLGDNIKRLFFSESGYLFEEPKNLLRQEFRDISLYSTVIEAVAGGATKMNEISQKTGISTAGLTQALNKLIKVRIIKKFIPILNEKNKRYSGYAVGDGMFRFWYRFVARGTTAITRGFGSQFFYARVKPYIHEYMGYVFEEMCQEYVMEKGIIGSLPVFVNETGKWIGQDNEKKQPSDIDVVGIDRVNKQAVIGECKFRNKQADSMEIEALADRKRLVAPYDVKDMLYFSLGGYDKVAIGKGEELGVRLLGISDIYA